MSVVRRFRAWMGVVLWDQGLVGTAIVGWCLASLLLVGPAGDPSDLLLRTGWTLLALGMLGLLRSREHGPSAYRAWLRATPWRHPDPLPFGPLTLVPQDGVVVGIGAAALALDGLVSPWSAPVAFGVGYLSGALPLVLATSRERALALVAVLGAATLAFPAPLPMLAALGAGYAITRRSILTHLADLHRLPAAGATHGPTTVHSDALSPAGPPARPPLGMRVAAIATVGWWAYVVSQLPMFEGLELDDMRVAVGLGVSAIAALDVARTKRTCAAPLGLWARVRTGRWVLPRHDVLWLGPVVSALAAWCGPVVLADRGVEPSVAAAASLCAALLLLWTVPPSYRTFVLTGDHRLRAGPLRLDTPL